MCALSAAMPLLAHPKTMKTATVLVGLAAPEDYPKSVALMMPKSGTCWMWK